ncbi:dephospho-CoA kinase [Pseudozobellia thermophila]|uniref:Dephospho-CoA kinase n=1 Tax=Pseudozobellia thermophila TaxID=192903 RepID=A0A1M6F957_9FLAO|nr:dephospho-CoA kinase [Pseudozobellia thermophila]SHI94237.1 dephospho-CoA kinase [Pseudozobellia thermophila]
MIVVGLTGGIGSGKTTVAGMFEDLGVPVYNSDKEAKNLMRSSPAVKEAIVRLLGDGAYAGDQLNRAYIAERIFNDEGLLAQINAIVHPAVRADFLDWKQRQKAPYVIQETALIFENKAQDLYDVIILVTAPENVRVRRVMSRDAGVSEADVKARIENQLGDDEKKATSHFVIENLDLERTRARVGQIHEQLLLKHP